MKRNPRAGWKPWTHDLNSAIIRAIMVVGFLPIMAFCAWEGGVKEGFAEFRNLWRDAGNPAPGELEEQDEDSKT